MIYLHCNSGCRIEGKINNMIGLNYLSFAIKNDLSYVIFDFAGSGNSEGKFISLGTEILT